MKIEKNTKPMRSKVTFYCYHDINIPSALHPRCPDLSILGVAPAAAAAAARNIAGVELFLRLLPSSPRLGVGVYAVRSADPNESFDRAFIVLEPLEG